MDRKVLEDNALTPEQIKLVMAENGKDIQREQEKAKIAVDNSEKAVKSLESQLEAVQKQITEYEEKLKAVEGVDEKAKAEIEKLQKENEAKIKEIQKTATAEITKNRQEADTEIANARREAETKEFLSGLGKKFVTPETARAFEAKINEALTDKANEGKNRKEIFEVLIKGEDGNERTDIFAADDTNNTSKPNAGGSTNPPPSTEPQTLIDALKLKYGK